MNHPTSLKLFYCFLFLFVANLQLTAQSKQHVNYEAKIDEIFKKYNDENKPGAAVAVVKDQKIVFKKGYGSANLEYNIPVSPSTVFHIASVSKQFTVFSILLLAEEGKLSFDDDIRKYIPEVPDFGKKITLRHLAAHTSGMRDQWSLLILAGWRFDDVITKEHILKTVANQKDLNFDPGEAYTYCNTGFTLLAEVVARITGKSFAEFTEERIFKPLKMKNTLFYDDHEKIVKNRAYSYYMQNDNYKKRVLNYANVGATSLFTTVEDLALWSMNFKSNIVGSKKIIEQMNTLAVLNNGSTFGGAYGQFVNTHKGLKQIQHGGADAGYRSYLGRFPDQDFSVMVFSNAAFANPNRLALQVADLYLKDELKEEKKKSNKSAESEAFIKLSKKELEQFKGLYWNEKESFSRKIYVRKGKLHYFRSFGNVSQLAPISKNEFKMLEVDADLIVKFEEKEGQKQMIVTVNDEPASVFEAYTKPTYTSEALKEYEGRFYSPELKTTYNIVVEGKKLVLTHSRASDTKFSVLKKDVFNFQRFLIKFHRNDANEIDGFKISTGRVQNLWLEKQ
jgi:CubicO group peptidase (beta-lactamase class C family)